jgi:hypothetical protein
VIDDIETYGVGTSMAVSGRAAISTLPLTTDYSEQAILLGRIKTGRETHRVVHVFPVTPGAAHATALTARCGERLPTADIQWLPALMGMPCERCVLSSVAP